MSKIAINNISNISEAWAKDFQIMIIKILVLIIIFQILIGYHLGFITISSLY